MSSNCSWFDEPPYHNYYAGSPREGLYFVYLNIFGEESPHPIVGNLYGYPIDSDFVLRVSTYCVFSSKFFIANILPAKILVWYSVCSNKSHRAFVLRARNLGLILNALSASSIVLTPINLCGFTSEVSRHMMRLFTASRASLIVRNSFSRNDSSYFVLCFK